MNGEVILMAPADSAPVWGVYRWGIGLIKAVQGEGSPALTALMKAVSVLGTEFFFAPVILFVLWCVNEKKGFRAGLLIILSGWINLYLKNLFHQPRPFNLDPSVQLAFESSFGFPSGHAQNTLVFLLCFFRGMDLRRKKGLLASALFLILLTGFSRLYLGLHFPTDLAGGWLVGGLILAVYFLACPRLEGFLARGGLRAALVCAAAAAFVMNALSQDDTTSLSGLLFGFAAGYGINRAYLGFASARAGGGGRPTPGILLMRYLLGLAGAGIIYLALSVALPGESSLFGGNLAFFRERLPFLLGGWDSTPWDDLGNFVRLGLVGLWLSAGAPWAFLRLGL